MPRVPARSVSKEQKSATTEASRTADGYMVESVGDVEDHHPIALEGHAMPYWVSPPLLPQGKQGGAMAATSSGDDNKTKESGTLVYTTYGGSGGSGGVGGGVGSGGGSSWDLQLAPLSKDGVVVGPPVMYETPGKSSSQIKWKTKIRG